MKSIVLVYDMLYTKYIYTTYIVLLYVSAGMMMMTTSALQKIVQTSLTTLFIFAMGE